MVTSYIIGAVLTFTFCWTVFRRYNMRLSHKSLRQQFCRYCTATLLTFVAVGAAQRSLAEPAMLMAALVSVLWICSFNILYDKTYRKCSPDYDNRIDIAFGIYLYGWLVGLHSVLTWFLPLEGAVIIGTIETALMLIPLVHIGYFVIYKTCADFAIMETVIDTNANEVIEFIKSFSWPKRIAMFIPLLLSIALCFAANIKGGERSNAVTASCADSRRHDSVLLLLHLEKTPWVILQNRTYRTLSQRERIQTHQ